MKHNKTIAVLLSLVLVFSLAAPAFADEGGDGSSVEVQETESVFTPEEGRSDATVDAQIPEDTSVLEDEQNTSLDVTMTLPDEVPEKEVGSPDNYVSHEMIVVFAESEPLDEQLDVLAEELDVYAQVAAGKEGEQSLSTLSTDELVVYELEETSSSGSTVLVELPEDLSVAQGVAIAEELPGVVSAQPNYLLTIADDGLESQAVPNDYEVGRQWSFYKTGVFEAWDYPEVSSLKTVQAGATATVAVIDTGVKLDHEDLAENLDTARAWDAVKGQPLKTTIAASGGTNNGDVQGHGTRVAGFIAAVANNDIGVAGITNNRVKVLPISIYEQGSSTAKTADLIKAIDKVIEYNNQGANISIINLSIGAYFQDANGNIADVTYEKAVELTSSLHAKIVEAQTKGITIVAAAGNRGNNTNYMPSGSTNAFIYPSDYHEVISVTSTDINDVIAPSSDHNQYKDIAAPGVSVISTSYSGSYLSGGGSSYASPLVAGTAALLKAVDSKLTPAEIADLLYKNSVDLGESGKDHYYGWGRLNVEATIGALIDTMTSPVEPPVEPEIDNPAPVNPAPTVPSPTVPTMWAQRSDGLWVFYENYTMIKNSWKQISGYWYYFDGNGVMQTGTFKDSWNRYYYLGAVGDGRMKTGWQLHSDGWRYHQANGVHYTGWYETNRAWYYLDGNNKGLMADSDAYRIGEKYYSFNPAPSGAMKTGWVQTPSGGVLYHKPAPSGAALFGWQLIDNGWYYFSANPALGSLTPGPYMTTGQHSVGDGVYLLGANGRMLTGWQIVNGAWNYYKPAPSGRMLTSGWVLDGSNWYYLNAQGRIAVSSWIPHGDSMCYVGANGVMYTGRQLIDGKMYYFDSAGKRQSGWVYYNPGWRYYDAEGVEVSKWIKLKGYWYYLNPNNFNLMATGSYIYAPSESGDYSNFDSEGRWLGYAAFTNGIDVSSWQPPLIGYQVDYDFMIVKATGGTGYKNPNMEMQADAALSRGKQLGFYHFGNDGFNGAAIAEADWFVSVITPYLGNAVLFLDYEMDLLGSDRQWIIDFCTRVKAKTGVTCHIYASGSWANDYIPDLWNELGCWLWQANYWYGYQTFWGYNPNTNSYMIPPSRGMKIHQYTSTGRLTGHNGNLDFNAFYGSRDEWIYYKTH